MKKIIFLLLNNYLIKKGSKIIKFNHKIKKNTSRKNLKIAINNILMMIFNFQDQLDGLKAKSNKLEEIYHKQMKHLIQIIL